MTRTYELGQHGLHAPKVRKLALYILELVLGEAARGLADKSEISATSRTKLLI